MDAPCGVKSSPYVNMLVMEIAAGQRSADGAGMTREAVRRWRLRPGFPEQPGEVGQAIAWNWEEVRRWADQRPTHASTKHGGAV